MHLAAMTMSDTYKSFPTYKEKAICIVDRLKEIYEVLLFEVQYEMPIRGEAHHQALGTMPA